MIDQSTVYSKVLGIGSQCEIFRVGSTLKKTMVEPRATGGELSGSQTESIRGEIKKSKLIRGKIKIKIKIN